MENKSFRRHSLNSVHRIIIVSALLFIMLFHAKSEAATRLYIRQGVTGHLSFTSLWIPNAKWEVTAGKSCLKLKSSAAKKPVYYGKKVGQATLTVYNKKNPSQRYDFYVYVMPSGKLNRMDFEMYGEMPEAAGEPAGTNYIDVFQNNYRQYRIIDIFGTGINKNNSGTKFQTTRTAKIFDSYKRITMLYGKASLKKWKASKDKVFQNYSKSFQNSVPAFKSTVKYYVQYKYGKTYGIRFYFNKKKEVVSIAYTKNWF